MLYSGVFNTEAHPFQAPPPKPQYGSGKHVSSKPLNLPFKSTKPLPKVSPAPLLHNVTVL